MTSCRYCHMAGVLISLALVTLTSWGWDTTRSATSNIQKELPFKAGATVWVIAEFQDVTITVKPISSVKVDVVQEATDFDAKSKLAEYLPTFVQLGGNVFIYVNKTKERLEPAELENKRLPDCVIGPARPGIFGRVSVEMPPGMNVSVITFSGRCNFKGDLGDAAVRFQTNTGRIEIEGAMQDLQTQTTYERVAVRLTRHIHSAEVGIDRGKVELDGSADSISVHSNSANVAVILPRAWAGTGKIETVSGGIRLQDIAGSKGQDNNHMSILGDSDGPKCTIKTGSGSILLKRNVV